jgi:hypothetical protein
VGRFKYTLAGRVLEALVLGAATGFGVFLAHQLRDPYSTVRLQLAELAEHARNLRRRTR